MWYISKTEKAKRKSKSPTRTKRHTSTHNKYILVRIINT